MMLVDTHCHLNFKAFNDDVEEVVLRAKRAGVRKIIVPGAAIDTSYKAIELAEKLEGVYATVGIHPHHEDKAGKEVEKELLRLSEKKQVVGFGETGLDYQKKQKKLSTSEKRRQKKLFRFHLELAKERGLPVVIHNRQAGEDVLGVLGGFEGIRGVFHCFSEDKEFLKKVIKMGFYVGIDGNVTYRKNLQEVALKVPLERLLLETDAPFLTPIPYRGLRNEPKNVKIVAKFVADLKGVSFEKIAKETTKNAERLFKI